MRYTNTSITATLLGVVWLAIMLKYTGVPYSWFGPTGARTPAYHDMANAVAWTRRHIDEVLQANRQAEWASLNDRRAAHTIAKLADQTEPPWTWQLQRGEGAESGRAGGRQVASRQAAPENDWTDAVAPPQFCVAVVTTERPALPDIVSVTMASLLVGVNASMLTDRLHLAVFNGALAPGNHTHARRWRARVPVLERPPEMVERLGLVNETWTRKETLDYTDALAYCVAMDSSYVLVLEDDAIAAPEGRWLEGLHHIVQMLELGGAAAAAGGGRHLGASHAIVRVFYTDDFRGFGNDKASAGILSAMALAACTAALATPRVLVRCQSRQNRNTGTARVRCGRAPLALAVAVNVVLMALAIGFQNFVPIGPGLVPSPPGFCCTQAILYGAEVARSISTLLRQSVDSPVPEVRQAPVDLLLANLIDQLQLPMYVWSPSLWQHIGILSSNPDRPSRIMLSATYRSGLTFDAPL